MEIVGGWGFQQKRWLASMHQDVLRVSFAERDRLLQVLYDLKLADHWNRKYVLALLNHCAADQIAFWQNEAFLGLAEAIAQYWQAKLSEGAIAQIV